MPNKVIKEEPIPELPFSKDSANIPENFKDLLDKNVFSIDPEGCEDVDDAMHIEKIDDSTFIIGIHIANPALFLPKDKLHDRWVQERLSSIYTPIKRIDMLHPDLAIKRASLLKDQIRPVNSLLFTVNSDEYGYKIVSVAFESCIIRNKANLSYDKAEEIHKHKKPFLSNSLTELVEVTNGLATRYLPTFKNGVEDMHRLVEAWMIFANLYTGQELVRRYDTLAPIRVLPVRSRSPRSSLSADPADSIHKTMEKTMKEEMVKEIILSKELTQFLEVRNNAAATYELYSPNNDEHSALGIRQYTHFSSPIRRYFDIIVHRMLFPNATLSKVNILPETTYQKGELQTLLTAINKKNSLIRKAERAFDRIRIVDELQKFCVYPIETMTIIDFSSSSIELYSEKWKTIIKYKIIPRLLKKRYYINEEGFLLEGQKKDNGLEGQTKILIQFRKFDKITIKSYPSACRSLMELNHELIEPLLVFS